MPVPGFGLAEPEIVAKDGACDAECVVDSVVEVLLISETLFGSVRNCYGKYGDADGEPSPLVKDEPATIEDVLRVKLSLYRAHQR